MTTEYMTAGKALQQRSDVALEPHELVQHSADDEIDLSEVFRELYASRWLIGAISVLTALLGGFYAWVASPIYSADALVQLEQRKSGMGALELAAMFEGSTPVTAEIDLILSRMVLGQTVDNLKLDIGAKPRYFPVFGAALARRAASGEAPAAPLLGMSGYAWGGEKIELGSLEIPAAWLGQGLRLVAGESGRYALFDPDDNHVLDGRVGEPAHTVTTEGDVRLFVAELVARAGTEFSLQRVPLLKVIEELRSNLKVAETGKQSGMVRLTLEGDSRLAPVRVLNEIVNIYVRKNVERRSAEAQQTLAFLETQLPDLKTQLDAAEARFNAFRLEHGSVDLAKETQAVLERIVAVEIKHSELARQRAELLRRYTPEHPAVRTLDSQIVSLEQELQGFSQRVHVLPDVQQKILRLSRDVQLSQDLYIALMNSAQELRVVQAGTIGNVRIVDYAMTAEEPVKPKKALIGAISVVLGMMLGIVAAFVRKLLFKGVEDPDSIEQRLGLPVYATVPHSPAQAQLERRGGIGAPLAVRAANEPAVESLRGLRTSLHFALLDAPNRVITITGPAPGVGKSFITANLAVVLVNAGQRVLIIDGDMRRGHLNKYFGLSRGPGLSDYLSGVAATADVIRPSGVENLDIITTGEYPPNPSELLMHPRFQALLESLAGSYDHILIDAPPILAVSDPAIAGRLSGATLLVIKSGQHHMREIEHSIKRLRQAGVSVRGVLFNDMTLHTRGYGYGGYAYAYQYGYGDEKRRKLA